MAVSNVELIVNAVKAINPLRQVNREGKKLQQVMTRSQRVMYNLGIVGERATKKIRAGFDRAARGAKALSEKLGGLKSALIGLGLGAVTKSIVNQAAQFAQTQIRIKALAGEYGEFDQVQKLIAKNAKTFNLSLAESSDQFADIFARLRPVGKSLEEIQTTFEGFNAVALVSGTSAGAASAAFLQLSQALGSGRLQGDEFRSISEQLPGILQLVADELKVQVQDLKKLGSEGKLTADVLINALAKGFDQNKDKIKAILEQSPAAQFKAFGNAVSELSNAVGTELLPVITPFVTKATDLLKQVGGLPQPLKQAAGGILLLGTAAAIALPAIGGLALTLNSMGVAQIAALGGIVVKLAAIGGTAALIFELSKSITEFQDLIDTGSVEDLEKEAGRLEKAIKNFEKPATIGGESLEGMGVSASVASGELTELQDKLSRVRTALAQRIDTRPEQGAFDFSAIQAAIAKAEKAMRPKPLTDEEKRRIANTKLQNKAATEGLLTSKAELGILKEQNATEKIRKQFALKRAQTQRRFADLISKALSDEERINLGAQLRNELEGLTLQQNQAISDELRNQYDSLSQVTDQMMEISPFTTQLSEEFKSMADTINNEIVTGIQSMIEGTKTLGQVASSMLRQIANQMLQTAIMGKRDSGGIGGMILRGLGLGGGGGLSGFAPSMAFDFKNAPNLFENPIDLPSFTDIPGDFKFANGGRPPVGKASLVGERGPELFVPSRAGTIVPNSQLGGSTSVVVNVDASGTEVQGNRGNADQLGRLIGQAVQAELIKQKRPGGLLTR